MTDERARTSAKTKDRVKPTADFKETGLSRGDRSGFQGGRALGALQDPHFLVLKLIKLMGASVCELIKRWAGPGGSGSGRAVWAVQFQGQGAHGFREQEYGIS